MDGSSDMSTLSQVLDKLRKKGKDIEFTYTEKGFGTEDGKVYEPGQVKIIKTYRFEGDSNPDDNSILYIIETHDGIIGYALDAYGAYSNTEEGFDDFIRQVPMEDREDQQIFGA